MAANERLNCVTRKILSEGYNNYVSNISSSDFDGLTVNQHRLKLI